MRAEYEEEIRIKQKIILQLKKEISDIQANENIQDTLICWENAAIDGYDNVLFILAFLMGVDNRSYNFVCDFLCEHDNSLGNYYHVEHLLEVKSCFELNQYIDGTWYWNTIGQSEDGKAFNIILYKKGQQNDPSFIQQCVRIDEHGIYFQDRCAHNKQQVASLTLPLKGIRKDQFFKFTEWVKNNG